MIRGGGRGGRGGKRDDRGRGGGASAAAQGRGATTSAAAFTVIKPRTDPKIEAEIREEAREMKKQGLFPRLLTSRSPARVAARGREGRKEGERKRSNAKVADAWQRRR